MILHCNYEELQALAGGAELILGPFAHGAGGSAVATTPAAARVALLQPRLNQSLEIETLDELRGVREAVEAICATLHEQMDAKVVEFHPAHEEAVTLYFDYAHAFGVLRRLDAMASEMTGMIELMTGAPPTDASAREVTFPG